jgi:putative DNA primase/helicase
MPLRGRRDDQDSAPDDSQQPSVSDPERGRPGTWEYLGLWRGPEIDLEATLRGLPASDLDAAELIRAEQPGRLHYAVASGTWHIWNGRCHQPDDGDRPFRLISDYAARARLLLDQCRAVTRQRAYLAAGEDAAPAERERMLKDAWAPWEAAVKYHAGLYRSAGHGALLKMLTGQCGTPGAVLDEHQPGWLNLADRTLHLDGSGWHPHNPADLLPYALDVPWLPGARCPQFCALARRAVGGDEDVFRYLMTALGYAMLGSNPERLIFFLDGPTSSGKSALLHIVRTLLGPLAHASQAALITVVRHGRNARTMNSIRGKRLITITETETRMTIDEGQVKMLTGEREIAVDQHYAKTEIRTPVTWVIFVATNKMPSLTDFEPAMRERVVVIPGGPTIPEHERDKRLADRIIGEEGPAIVAALAAACAQYHRSGLVMPLAVRMKTDTYAAEQNTVENFLADTCQFAGGYAPGGVAISIHQHEMWLQYLSWSRGGARLGRTEFQKQVADHPLITLSRRRFEGVFWNQEIMKAMQNGHDPS